LRQGGLQWYIVRRLIYAVIIAFGVVTITFILLRLGPSSPADKYLANMSARTQDPAQVITAWSFSTSMPVMEVIKKHWVYSFQLIFLSMVFSAVLGILIGVYSAIKQYTKTDYLATFFSFIGISIPNFWLGIMLILIFSVQLGWFKTYYDTGLPMFSLANLKALVLPVITLGTGMMAGYTRYARSATLENLRKDFVKTARAKGLPEWTVIGKHVFRNAILPIITIIMFDLSGVVFGGAYLTEIIFGIPGLGRISFNAIFANDYPLVVTITLIGAIVVLLTNLATDIVYTWLDPRIRYD